MTIKVGINGFGRIGRCTLSHIAASGRDDIEVVRINATGPLETAAHLIKYDSVHGRFPNEVKVGNGTLDQERRPHGGLRRERRRIADLGHDGIERVVHHQLSGADGQGAA